MALEAHGIFLVGTGDRGDIPSYIAIRPCASVGLISSCDMDWDRNGAWKKT